MVVSFRKFPVRCQRTGTCGGVSLCNSLFSVGATHASPLLAQKSPCASRPSTRLRTGFPLWQRGTEGDFPAYGASSEWAAGDETGNHFQTETLPERLICGPGSGHSGRQRGGRYGWTARRHPGAGFRHGCGRTAGHHLSGSARRRRDQGRAAQRRYCPPPQRPAPRTRQTPENPPQSPFGKGGSLS